MSFRPSGWNVVIVGRWNPAILTPQGILKHVFDLPDGTQTHVAVPLDGVSPYLVTHPNEMIVARADQQRVIIDLKEKTYKALGEAMKAGVNVLTSLPETPVSAAGFNLRFESDDPSADHLAWTEAKIDARLSDQAWRIAERSVTRALHYEAGVLNLTVNGKEGKVGVLCNFHRTCAEHADLVRWLETPYDQVRDKVLGLLTSLDIEIEETVHDNDDGE